MWAVKSCSRFVDLRPLLFYLPNISIFYTGLPAEGSVTLFSPWLFSFEQENRTKLCPLCCFSTGVGNFWRLLTPRFICNPQLDCPEGQGAALGYSHASFFHCGALVGEK